MRKHQLYYEAEAQGRRRATEIYRASVATDELDDLGKRLDQIRWTLRCSTSPWAKQHWLGNGNQTRRWATFGWRDSAPWIGKSALQKTKNSFPG